MIVVIAFAPLWRVIAQFLRPCLLRTVIGVPCPTCGATRGTMALLEGRIVEALTLNPLVATSVAVFLVGGVIAPLWAWRKGTAPRLPSPLPMWARLGMVGAILANWAWVVVRG